MILNPSLPTTVKGSTTSRGATNGGSAVGCSFPNTELMQLKVEMETAETAGALAVLNSESGKELTRRAGEIFSNLLGPVTEQLGLTLGDYAAYYRLKRLVSLGDKAQKLLHGKRITESPNLGRILPIIQVSSMESDEDLHSRWAALLANTLLEPESVHPSYIETLKQLLSEDAQFLDKAVDYVREHPEHIYRKLTAGDFSRVWYGPPGILAHNARRHGKFMRNRLDTLERLGLVKRFDFPKRDQKFLRNDTEERYIIPTFSFGFVDACRGITADSDDE